MSLSDKIGLHPEVPETTLLIEDVKEFIKELKEELYPLLPTHYELTMVKLIDKLVGKDLI